MKEAKVDQFEINNAELFLGCEASWRKLFSITPVGFIQFYIRRGQCQKRSTLSIALYWVAVLIVLGVILFPQLIANLIAG
jgi:hypothetical protein